VSKESEASIIGALLLDFDPCKTALDQLIPECFENTFTREAFNAIKALSDSGEKIDAVSVLGKMGSTLENRKGLLACADLVPSIANIQAYVNIQLNDWQKRRIYTEFSGAICDIAPIEDASEVISRLDELLQREKEINKGFGGSDWITLKQAADDFLAGLKAEKARGKPTGFVNLDRHIGGIMDGTVTVIAARPGQGKTTLALNIALNMAAGEYKTGFFSMEMTTEQQLQKLASRICRINSMRIRDSNLSDCEYEKVSGAMSCIEHMPLQFYEIPVGIAEIRREVEKVKPHVIVIDYLGIMKMNEKKQLREALGEITGGLKQLALIKKISIILIVQMNRDIESRGGKPMLRDLRDSGTIEQDADNVIFITSEKKEGQAISGDDFVKSKLWIEKCRSGQTGVVDVKWHPQYHDFIEIEPDYLHNDPPPSIVTNSVDPPQRSANTATSRQPWTGLPLTASAKRSDTLN